MGAVLIVLAIVVVIAIAVVAHHFEKKRREAIRQWATSNGWSYADEDDRWVDAWAGAPFGEGHSREAANVLQRSVGGRDAVVFDYSYKVTTSNGKTTTTTTYEFSVYGQRIPAALPSMTVEPEGLWDKTAKLFGAQDIELESVEFNDRYRVKADDAKVAYDVLNARTMEALLLVDGIDFRIQGDWLVAVEKGDLDVLRIPRLIHVLSGIVDRVPSFVWTDRGARSDGGSA